MIHRPAAISAALPAFLIAVLFELRSKVVLTEERITVVNIFRTHSIPWTEVEYVSFGTPGASAQTLFVRAIGTIGFVKLKVRERPTEITVRASFSASMPAFRPFLVHLERLLDLHGVRRDPHYVIWRERTPYD